MPNRGSGPSKLSEKVPSLDVACFVPASMDSSVWACVLSGSVIVRICLFSDKFCVA